MRSVEQIRQQFPALQHCRDVLLDNAGGSQAPRQVIDAIRDYMLTSYVQLGADYQTSISALPAMVALDGFITSHTTMVVELPEQEQVDAFLPELTVPHRLRFEHPTTVGGLTWPRESAHLRHSIQTAMERVAEVLDEALADFERIFGRRPHGPMEPYHTDDAEIILVACNTMARTARRLVDARRARGERIGMVQAKLFRPFASAALQAAIGSATRIGVLDRNHSPGAGGIFWQEALTALRSRPELLVQNYIVGLCGGDVTPEVLDHIVDDLAARGTVAAPVWEEVAL